MTMSGTRRPRVLIVLSHYLPGFKAGGPVRSIEGLTEQLGAEIELFIVTLDRDLGDRQPYAGLDTGIWLEVGKAKVMYLRALAFHPAQFRWLLKTVLPDTIYLNALFSIRFAVLPLVAQRQRSPTVQIVLAPRGSLSKAALGIRSWKKGPFLKALRYTGLLSKITWQASTDSEATEIRAAVGTSTASPCRAKSATPGTTKTASHRETSWTPPGSLRLTTLAEKEPAIPPRSPQIRARTPRLGHYRAGRGPDLLEAMHGVNATSPTGVVVSYRGEMDHDLIAEELITHDLFVLPTLNENFGHAILESLSAGTPVLISDQTPWRGLANAGAGWDLDLSHPERFRAALEASIEMDEPAVCEDVSSGIRPGATLAQHGRCSGSEPAIARRTAPALS